MPLIDPNRSVVPLDERLAKETNAVFRRQLEEVRFHIATEVYGDVEPALARLSEHAVYELYDNVNPPTSIAGVEAIRSNFYDGLAQMMDPRLEWYSTRVLVDEGHVLTEGDQKCAFRGSYLASQGFDVDPDRFYLSEQHHLVVWPFDEAGKLIGETIFFGYLTPLAEVAQRPLTPAECGEWTLGPIAVPAAG